MQTLPAANIILQPTLSLPKIAILLFYLRVNPNKSFRYTVFAVVFIIACYTIGLMMAVVFPCTPVKKLWNPLTPGKCIDQNPIYLASVIINTSVDVIVLVLPIPMLIKLQVNTRTKVLLGSLFAFCSATVLISAVRIWSTTIILGNEDFTWDVANADSLAVCELNLTVVCGSVLTLRPFCRQHLPFLFGGRRSRPTDESPNGPNHALNFAGPSGPKSKSNYRAKIIGGRSGGFAGSNRPVKRSLWTGLGSTLVKDDDEDLESLSAELRTLAPNVRHPGDAGIGAGGLENRPVGEGGRPHVSDTAIGPRPGGLSDSYLPVSRTDVLDQGIMKTVSLDVR